MSDPIHPLLASTSCPPQTLCDLCCGQQAIIAQMIHGPHTQRLMALGFLPGCPLRFIRSAPWGDPLMVEVLGSIVCLRRSEAAGIQVQTANSM